MSRSMLFSLLFFGATWPGLAYLLSGELTARGHAAVAALAFAAVFGAILIMGALNEMSEEINRLRDALIGEKK